VKFLGQKTEAKFWVMDEILGWGQHYGLGVIILDWSCNFCWGKMFGQGQNDRAQFQV